MSLNLFTIGKPDDKIALHTRYCRDFIRFSQNNSKCVKSSKRCNVRVNKILHRYTRYIFYLPPAIFVLRLLS